jgi:hypothetical protein
VDKCFEFRQGGLGTGDGIMHLAVTIFFDKGILSIENGS